MDTTGTSTTPDLRDTAANRLEVVHRLIAASLEDLTEDEAQRSPTSGLSPVVWQVGHLALMTGWMTERLGGAYTPPPTYEERFQRGTGGPGRYPTLAEVRRAFDDSHQAILGVIRTTDLGQPLDIMGMTRHRGDLAVMCAAHYGYHMAKIATLRALLGKPRLT